MSTPTNVVTQILERIHVMPEEEVPLTAAVGWVLANDVRALVSHPAYDFAAGDTILTARNVITPTSVGLIAAAGVGTVCVFRRPTVAVLTAGDNLVMLDRLDDVRAGDKVVSSNSYVLPVLVQDAGGVPCNCGIVGSDPASTHHVIESVLGCDLLVSTDAGGAHDPLRRVFDMMGADVMFDDALESTKIPLVFGMLDDTPWLGLPGDPAWTVTAFERLVRPAIRKMCGHLAAH